MYWMICVEMQSMIPRILSGKNSYRLSNYWSGYWAYSNDYFLHSRKTIYAITLKGEK